MLVYVDCQSRVAVSAVCNKDARLQQCEGAWGIGDLKLYPEIYICILVCSKSYGITVLTVWYRVRVLPVRILCLK